MFFPLRAALVIGAIFYLSPVRPPLFAEEGARPLADVLPTLPEGLRDQAIRVGAEALARGALDGHAALARAGLDRETGAEAPTPSRDTLREGDRSAPWRGTEPKIRR